MHFNLVYSFIQQVFLSQALWLILEYRDNKTQFLPSRSSQLIMKLSEQIDGYNMTLAGIT